MILKRFWKLIALSLVIIIVLVTYFIYTSLVVAKQFPELTLKTIDGDKSVMNDVLLVGEYDGKSNYSTVTVSTEGSVYRGQMSFFENLESPFAINNATKLKEKYRNFMRGKWIYTGNFFENDEFVAYVTVKSTSSRLHYEDAENYFYVDVLNKETNKSNSFEIKIPGQGLYYDIVVSDVQLVNGELKVLTESNHYGNAGRYVRELMVYTIDISSHKISADDPLLVSESVEDANNWEDIMFLNDSEDISEQKFYFLQKDQNRREVEGTELETEIVDNEPTEISVVNRSFYLYDLESKELQEVIFDKEIANELLDARTWGFVQDRQVYLVYELENTVTILEINEQDLSVQSKAKFNLDDSGFRGLSNLTIVNDKMYAIGNKDDVNSGKVFVGAIHNGEVLFEGEIGMENPDEENEEHELRFYRLIMN
ncbi:hypothetical protein [Ornithinibacillus sp. JPR2-1]|uniref:hypothetical protein n=1 Tax=Ornithinibacillus sp. JPR2-1 TaxID=2094019 RepID=UPI0031CDF53A